MPFLTGYVRQAALVALTLVMLWTNLVIGTGSFSRDGAEGDVQSVYWLYQSAFTPAPFTFAVWLPIFLGCIYVAVVQALPKYRHNAALDRYAPYYVGGLIANALTPFAPLGWGLVVTAALFVFLALAYRALVRGNTASRIASPWIFRIPLLLFATWAGIATVLNATQIIVAMGGNVGELAAALLVAIVMALGAWAIYRTREVTILVVMAWAGLGIATGNMELSILILTIVVTTCLSAWIAMKATNRPNYGAS
jgi:translocator protein